MNNIPEAQNNLEALHYLIAWGAALLGVISLGRLIRSAIKYYVASGDAEKMRINRNIILHAIINFLVSFLISALAFFALNIS